MSSDFVTISSTGNNHLHIKMTDTNLTAVLHKPNDLRLVSYCYIFSYANSIYYSIQKVLYYRL